MLRSLFVASFVVTVAAASCSSDATDDPDAVVAGEAGKAGQPASGGDSSEGGAPAAAGARSVGGALEPATGGAAGAAEAPVSGAGGRGAGEAGSGSLAGGEASGAAGMAGAGGAEAPSDCGKLIVNAGCEDADAQTQDYQSGEFQGCVHFRSAQTGWVNYDGFGGFAYQVETGLAWVIRTPMTMNRAQVAAFCADFEFVGSSNWRLPTIDEVRAFNAGCAPTAQGGTCELADPACLTQDCGTGAKCISCTAHQGPYGVSKDYCPADAPFCISIATSSNCSDCGMDADWRNGPINGNFFAAGSSSLTFPVCVSDDVQRAVPCAP
jgi:hypothetical protein